jgi:hypothetical protein
MVSTLKRLSQPASTKRDFSFLSLPISEYLKVLNLSISKYFLPTALKPASSFSFFPSGVPSLAKQENITNMKKNN